MKWLWLAVILRRPYIRHPEDGKYDIYDALHGKRDVGIYGQPESYAMLDIHERNGTAPDATVDEESGLPASLMAGRGKKSGGTKDVQMVEETKEVQDPEPTHQEYSNTYGSEKM